MNEGVRTNAYLEEILFNLVRWLNSSGGEKYPFWSSSMQFFF